MKKNRLFASALLASCVSLSLASETNFINGAGTYTDPSVNYSTANFSAYVSLPGSSGSAALFSAKYDDSTGEPEICLGFVTADHVMTGENSYSYYLHDGNHFDQLDSGSLTHEYDARGKDSRYAGNEDMGFTGFKVVQAFTDPNEWNNLLGLTQASSGINGILGTASSTSGLVQTNYGYGLSGRYLFHDTISGNSFTATSYTPGPGGGENLVGDGFAWRNTYPAGLGAGTDRFTNTHSSGIVAGANITGYQYDSLQWKVENKNGYGAISQGDSGGAILNFNGALVGVNTFTTGAVYKDGAGNVTGRDWDYGSTQGGLAFTNDDVNWLNNQFMTFCDQAAPEPLTLVAFAAGLLGLLVFRRRS